MSTELSIVIPVLNEEKNIPILVDRIKDVMSGVDSNYEVIFVDDGSTDGTFNVLKSLYEKNVIHKVIEFRRNFGKSVALSAGFKLAEGNIIITMDGDLQDDPDEIPIYILEMQML